MAQLGPLLGFSQCCTSIYTLSPASHLRPSSCRSLAEFKSLWLQDKALGSYRLSLLHKLFTTWLIVSSGPMRKCLLSLPFLDGPDSLSKVRLTHSNLLIDSKSTTEDLIHIFKNPFIFDLQSNLITGVFPSYKQAPPLVEMRELYSLCTSGGGTLAGYLGMANHSDLHSFIQSTMPLMPSYSRKP